jgi:hypothetical protein
LNLRQLALAGVAALAAVGTAGPAVVAQTPTPTPVIAPGTPTPAASPSPATGRTRRGASPAPSASPSPAPPQFQSLDGVWEVQLQPLDGSGRTIYSHLYVTQKGDDVSGTWARTPKQRLPFSGTFDGRLFNLTVKDGAKTYTLTGYAENFSDMVGMVTSSDPKETGTPFTASHRKKERPES